MTTSYTQMAIIGKKWGRFRSASSKNCCYKRLYLAAPYTKKLHRLQCSLHCSTGYYKLSKLNNERLPFSAWATIFLRFSAYFPSPDANFSVAGCTTNNVGINIEFHVPNSWLCLASLQLTVRNRVR